VYGPPAVAVDAAGRVTGVTRAQLDKRPDEIAAMFDGVAERYDRTNTILSFGLDRMWRQATRSALALGPGDVVLDLAAGTGVSTLELSRSGARVIGLDISLGMLRAGKKTRPDATLLAGDALSLPFADATFDAITISFGLRNIHDTAAALAEMARVTKPGGRIVICEFSHPTNGAFRHAYLAYLMAALPSVARKIASNPDAYVYLAESIRAWPDQAGLAAKMAAAGWTNVAWRNLTGGIVALHRGRRPEAPRRP
jgi:demethylmenaquinone methyltransferase/2-methoxy-6-polyprenyl-1,4-benzoquinol methylase